MDVSENSFISVVEDIKQIAQDLLEENKNQQVITVLYFKDKADNEPRVRYRRFESIPQMQQLNYLKVVTESKNTRPRELFKGDTLLVEYPVYQVKIKQSKIEEYLMGLGLLIVSNPPSYDNNKLSFMGKTIEIRGNDQSMVCEALFKNGKSIKKLWNWDEVFEEAGETNIKKEMWHKVYNSRIKINEKIGRKTGIYDLLVSPNTKTIQVNQKYISKI